MNTNATTPAPEQCPPIATGWVFGCTPLEPSTALHQYRPADDADRRWIDIESEEVLACVKAMPERFTLRTVFTTSVDRLVQAPSATVCAALAVVDQARRDREAAALKLRAALAILEEMP